MNLNFKIWEFEISFSQEEKICLMGKIWEAVDKNRIRKQKLENRNIIRKPREYYEVGINVT